MNLRRLLARVHRACRWTVGIGAILALPLGLLWEPGFLAIVAAGVGATIVLMSTGGLDSSATKPDQGRAEGELPEIFS